MQVSDKQNRKKRSKPTLLQLKRAINLIFDKYDTDKSGYLDQQEIINLLNDSLAKQGKTTHTTQTQLKAFVEKCDKNSDGIIDKQQLQNILFYYLNVL